MASTCTSSSSSSTAALEVCPTTTTTTCKKFVICDLQNQKDTTSTTTTYCNDILKIDEEMTREFNWEDLFDRTGSGPAEGGLFQHLDIANTLYSEKRLKHGQIVEVYLRTTDLGLIGEQGSKITTEFEKSSEETEAKEDSAAGIEILDHVDDQKAGENEVLDGAKFSENRCSVPVQNSSFTSDSDSDLLWTPAKVEVVCANELFVRLIPTDIWNGSNSLKNAETSSSGGNVNNNCDENSAAVARPHQVEFRPKTAWVKLDEVRFCPRANEIAEELESDAESERKKNGGRESSPEQQSTSDDDSSRNSATGNKKRAKLEPKSTAAADSETVPQPTVDDFRIDLNETMVTRVGAGQFLEVQDKHDPTLVHIGKVEQNFGGLLAISQQCHHQDCSTSPPPPPPSTSSETGGTTAGENREIHSKNGANLNECLYVTSERLHKLGWHKTTDQNCALDPKCDDWVRNQPEQETQRPEQNPVPDDVFESFVVKEHKFEVGMQLEVLDPISKAMFYPGTVRKLLNRHYFIVQIHRKVHLKDPEDQDSIFVVSEVENPKNWLVCHRGTFGIFPVYWCHRYGIHITPPEGYNEVEFSWPTYRNSLGIQKLEATGFDFPRQVQGYLTGKKLEITGIVNNRGKAKGIQPVIALPATVVRSFRHLIWIHFDHHVDMSAPRIYSVNSPNVFPCGWAKENGIQMYVPYRIPTIMPSIDLSVQYSSQRQNVFAKPKQFYLSEKWLKNGHLWLPKVHVNLNCFAGPFLVPERLRKLPRYFGPGPMPLVLKSLIGRLMSCAYKLKDLVEILHCPREKSDGSLPLLEVKARVKKLRSRQYKISIPTCRSASDFPQFAAHFLQLLDACPYLFSTEKLATAKECPAKCYQIASCSYMTARHHANTATYFSKLTSKVPKKYRKGSLLGVVHPVPVRKKKDKPTCPPTLPEGRRPVTRGIKLPKFGYYGTNSGTQCSSSGTTNQQQVCLRSPVTAAAKRSVKVAVQQRKNNGNISSPRTLPSSSKHISVGGGVAQAQKAGIQVRPIATVSAHQKAKPQTSQESGNNTKTTTSISGYAIPTIKSNPNNWTSKMLANYLRETDSAFIATRLVKEEVDGQAFMLLTLKDCMQYLDLKLGPALKLSAIINEMKMIYLERYAKNKEPILGVGGGGEKKL